MADLTQAQVEAMITAINAQLLTLVSDPKPNYSEGEFSVSWGDVQRILLEQLKYYREMLQSFPAEEITQGEFY